MARRRLLSDEHWAGLFALPADEHEIVRHCTLAPDDLAAAAAKRAAHNRLGYALLLCALRHPGRALDSGEAPPAPMVAYVALGGRGAPVPRELQGHVAPLGWEHIGLIGDYV